MPLETIASSPLDASTLLSTTRHHQPLTAAVAPPLVVTARHSSFAPGSDGSRHQAAAFGTSSRVMTSQRQQDAFDSRATQRYFTTHFDQLNTAGSDQKPVLITRNSTLFEPFRVNNNNNRNDLDNECHAGHKVQGQGCEEIQWDSGCSDSNDAPDLVSFCESEASYDDSSAIVDDDDDAATAAAQFPLELAAPELDLEQIESDYQ